MLLGSSFKNVYSVEGFFDDEENVYYGVTRNGRNCRFFAYDFEKKEITKVVELPNTSGAWAIKKIYKKIYIGAYEDALLYIYDLEKDYLDTPIHLTEEKYIWSMVADEDYLYIGTYPHARVYKYSFKEEKLEGDYIEIEESKYVRSLSVYGDYLFLGIGPNARFFSYNKLNGELKEAKLPFLEGQSFVYTQEIIDNNLVIRVSPINKYYHMDLSNFSSDNWDFNIIEKGEIPDVDTSLEYYFLGHILFYNPSRGEFQFIEETPITEISMFNYKGTWYIVDLNLRVYSLENILEPDNYLVKMNLEPDDSIPFSISTVDTTLLIGERGLRVLSKEQDDYYYDIPREIKSICALEEYVFTANYMKAILYKIPVTDKSKSLKLDIDNMEEIEIGYEQNRPKVIKCNKINNYVAVTTEPNYGIWGGALSVYNSNTGELQVYRNIVKDHSPFDLTFDNDNTGILYFTTIHRGGTGTDIGDDASYLVKFNYLTGEIIYEKQFHEEKSIMRGVDIIGDNLLVRNDQKEIFLVNKENGEVVNKIIEKDFRGSLVTEDERVFLYDRKSLYELDIDRFEISKTEYEFENLLKLIEVNDKIYYFDGYDYGYLK